MRFDGMIVDESHFLNGHKTVQSKAVYRISRKADKRLALTGTPVRNKPDQIFGILHYLYPEKFNSYWQFVERYFNIFDAPWGSKKIGKYKREQELVEILDTLSIQMKRKDKFKWLPEKQYIELEVEMDATQKRAYDSMVDTFMVEEEGELKADAPSVLAQLTRLRQICLSPSLLELKAPSAKEIALMEWLDDNPGESVVVFSAFSSYLKQLQPKIKGSVLLHGEMSATEKQRSVDAIQSGKARVLLANIIAGGTGFTIDNAETVIFLDRDFTVANNEQAEDRIVPVSQERNHNCTVIDIVVKDSVDQKISNLLRAKKNITEVINSYQGIKELMK